MKLLKKIIHGSKWRIRKWWYALKIRVLVKLFIRRVTKASWIRGGVRWIARILISSVLFVPIRTVLSIFLRYAGYSVVKSNERGLRLSPVKMEARLSLERASRAIEFASTFYEFKSEEGERDISSESVVDTAQWSVAIIIPTFNDSAFLPDALKSLLEQTWEHWNCYVVDDCSSEEVAEIVDETVQRDPRFKVVTHSRNLGLAASRNTGIAVSSEPLIQFLDSDDMLTPWSLEMKVKAIQEADTECSGSYGQVIQCTEETQLAELRSWNHRVSAQDKHFYNSDGESPFVVHAPLIKRKEVERVGGFDESYLNGAEDWEFWHRVMRTGALFVGTGRVVGAYRQRSNSMIRDFPQVHLARADSLLKLAEVTAKYSDGKLTRAPYSYSEGKSALLRGKRLAVWSGLRTASLWMNQIEDGKRPESILGQEAMTFLERPIPPVFKKDIEISARRGLIRGLGLSPEVSGKLSQDEQKLLNLAAIEIVEGLFEYSPTDLGPNGEDPGIAVDLALPEHQIVLFPAHAGDAKILESHAHRPSLIVDLSSATGDFGEAALLSELTDSPTVSISEFMLRYNSSEPCDWIAVEPIHPAIRYLLKRFPQDINIVSGTRPESDALPEKLSFGNDYRLHIHREESSLHEASVGKLLDLKDHYAGQTCVIIGNGPSLNKTPIDWVAKVPHFAVNSYFLLEDKIERPPDFYVVEDTAVFKDNLPEIVNFEAQLKILPTIYFDRYKPVREEELLFFRMNQGFYGRATGALSVPRFSTRADSRLYCGQSVTIINLQLAHWFGFSKVLLVGMDFSYSIPSDAQISGNQILSQSDDPNHFDPRYFGHGKTWKDPKLDRVLQSYALSKSVFERDGREIINCTEGGALEIFRRSDLEQEISKSTNLQN